ncbi:MAG: hypothetical protein AAGC70_16910 [Pseudomonadota bacterium]
MTAAPSPTLSGQHLKLRPPEQVMRLSRMGAFYPTRLSFMRKLIRRLNREQAVVSRPVWEIDVDGYGRAVYSVPLGGDVYSLVAFSTPLAPEHRSDRVIAEAWDTTYVLYDGVPTSRDLDRLAKNVPHQEAGRFAQTELVLCRANKSVRLFEHVVERLSHGRQPDAEMIRRIGYLLRTTAVYGNGKFGIADRSRIEMRPALHGAFQAEMLAVWLVRGFTHDLVEHIAVVRGGYHAVPLQAVVKRHIGVGNATGLGMAPFLISHPTLLHNWMLERETALAMVRAERHAAPETIDRFCTLVGRAGQHLEEWTTDDTIQASRTHSVRQELKDVAALTTSAWLAEPFPWDRLITHAERWSLECQELLVALILEPHGHLIDDIARHWSGAQTPQTAPGMTLRELDRHIANQFAWALAIDFGSPKASHYFWYVSEDKQEPRLGDRRNEAGADQEMPLDVARQIQALAQALTTSDPDETTATFLIRRPDLRYVVRRVQTAVRHPYSEIQDNLISADCRPIDLLRCKLAQFGASKFDPKSDRWTRITLFQGAPTFDTIHGSDADDWCFPILDQGDEAVTQ